ASRGGVLDRNRDAVALSLPARAVYADPHLVRDPALESAIVAQALRLDPAVVGNEMRAPGRFVYLARGVDPDTARSLEARHLAGLGFLDESRRYYPAGDLASQVLGFVGIDGSGLAGLELRYQG